MIGSTEFQNVVDFSDQIASWVVNINPFEKLSGAVCTLVVTTIDAYTLYLPNYFEKDSQIWYINLTNWEFGPHIWCSST